MPLSGRAKQLEFGHLPNPGESGWTATPLSLVVKINQRSPAEPLSLLRSML